MIDFAALNKMHVSMTMLLAVVVIALLLILWAWHRQSDNAIDLKDLICRNGALDEKKFTRFGAWIVSTWGFVYLILDDQFTEWYFTGYMAIWVGNAIAEKWLANKQ